ncbi:XTP/dITP diphosphatase [Virgibacillus sp. W0430]|uniref:XTP/dITP diphosphatase n=1 Tax=Virgibacillus sp. W0430 TaxID=3391580 RepID=UPI003F463D92
MEHVLVATKNKGKAIEFQQLFQKYGRKSKSLLDIDGNIPDIEETGETFEENAKIKAETISNLLQTTVLADDSGLIIDALNGSPGVFSARYAGENSTDQANIDKVMNEMIHIPENERSARFICVIAVAVPGKDTFFRTGVCEGRIAFKQSGANGFGYDPIFIPQDFERTMAELTSEEKNKISHRTNALNKLEKWISNQR